jgi:hypothetical protein
LLIKKYVHLENRQFHYMISMRVNILPKLNLNKGSFVYLY